MGNTEPVDDDAEHLRASAEARLEAVKAVLWAATHGQDLVSLVSAASTRQKALEALMRQPHHWTELQAQHMLDATFGQLSESGVAALREELEQLGQGDASPPGSS